MVLVVKHRANKIEEKKTKKKNQQKKWPTICGPTNLFIIKNLFKICFDFFFCFCLKSFFEISINDIFGAHEMGYCFDI